MKFFEKNHIEVNQTTTDRSSSVARPKYSIEPNSNKEAEEAQSMEKNRQIERQLKLLNRKESGASVKQASKSGSIDNTT